MKRLLGVDSGSRRVGLAISDPLGLLAHPLSVVGRSGAVDEIARIVADEDVGTVVVGLPTGLSGGEGRSAGEARRLAAEIEERTGVEVVLVDERFTSRIADGSLLGIGLKRRDRRRLADKVAAAIILQEYLDRKR